MNSRNLVIKTFFFRLSFPFVTLALLARPSWGADYTRHAPSSNTEILHGFEQYAAKSNKELFSQSFLHSDKSLRPLEEFAYYILERHLSNRLHEQLRHSKFKQDEQLRKFHPEETEKIIQIQKKALTFERKHIRAVVAIYQDFPRHQVLNLLEVILPLLLDQHLDNPEFYVSHGVDHSLNVMNYSNQILEKIPGLEESIAKRYHLTKAEVEVTLQTVALLHDIGYSGLGKSDKALHGHLGSLYLQRIIPKFAALLSSEAKKKELIKDMVLSVHTHSSDKIEKTFDIQITTKEHIYLCTEKRFQEVLIELQKTDQIITKVKAPTAETLRKLNRIYLQNKHGPSKVQWQLAKNSFLGRKVHFENETHSSFGLPFKRVDFKRHPLSATLRLADNMDILPNRLSSLQKNPVFQRTYQVLGTKNAVSNFLEKIEGMPKNNFTTLEQIPKNVLYLFSGNTQKVWQNDALRKAIALKLIESDPEFSKQNPEMQMELKASAQYLNTKQFPHFGGTEPIQGIELVPTESNQVKLMVIVDKNRFDELNHFSTTESLTLSPDHTQLMEVKIGEYQVFRLRQALESISIESKPILVEIKTKS